MRLSTIDDSEFVTQVAATSDEQLAETMSGKLRDDILSEIFDRMQQHFEPCRADGVDAVVTWNICGRPDGECDCYQMRIGAGACEINGCCEERADVRLTLDPVSFLKLVAGQASGPGLMLRGKLRPAGDVRLARRLQAMFRLPTTAGAHSGENDQ
jgi:SCP-2 sterol transfer family